MHPPRLQRTIEGDSYAIGCFVAAVVVFGLGWIGLFIPVVQAEPGRIHVTEVIVFVAYMSSVLPILPAVLVCCGIVILVLGRIIRFLRRV